MELTEACILAIGLLHCTDDLAAMEASVDTSESSSLSEPEYSLPSRSVSFASLASLDDFVGGFGRGGGF